MDFSLATSAGPFAAGGFGIMALGLLIRGPVGAWIARLFGLATLALVVGIGFYAGVVVAVDCWTENPDATWMALAGFSFMSYFLIQAAKVVIKRREEDDDDEDEGGLRVFAPPPPPPAFPGPEPEPAPAGPGLDYWDEFDTQRERWGAPVPDRDTVGV